jgi:hypothetical protein
MNLGGRKLFKNFKNKRYWILLLPSLLIGVTLISYLPQELKPFGILTVLPFWLVYYFCTHFNKRRNEELVELGQFDREKNIFNQFKNCMISLASNPIDQIKSELPGCITDDLLITFDTYYKDFIEIKSFKLSEKQLHLLNEIDKMSDEMNAEPLFIYSEEEIETSDYKKILESIEWNTIRRYSLEFVELMNWELKVLTRYQQIDENIWHKE